MDSLSLADRAVLASLQEVIVDVTRGLEEYKLSEVGERLYSFVWDYFCDWYLELSKGETNPAVLVHVLRTALQLLHPYCPFVTEELWAEVGSKDSDMLMKSAWPVVDDGFQDKSAMDDLQRVIDVISAIRSLRSDAGLEPGKTVAVTIVSKHADFFELQKDHIERLAKCNLVIVETARRGVSTKDIMSAFLKDTEVHLSLEGLIDIEKERKKLQAEKEKLEGFIRGIEKKLENSQFVDNAPEAVVSMEKEKLASSTEKLAKVEERLGNLEG